ncbi:restriction endonuclease fold toxin 5 domain-containing protein [Paraburkholderia sp. BL21I4N1]|uniref:restriction endonuclease fold toxin 5 domain-containing protein n=1 Tax=Paraburkholderia sp. BL21I4N1 TaxID=1938801 RepID=UPI000CFDC031|nr:restriction endonuclease fold toxin 5 domain-containing protein [Paraburkholderia sp. BL21I4N1]PQV51055.1 restriction endonuclease fold toxin 5 of polymorphic toxin system [Paraburkholderia sp. BL21I4N1]
MGTLFAPLLEAAVAELGPVLLSAGKALLGGAATGAVGSVAGDASKDDSKSTPAVRALPRTREGCRKCPPEGGAKVRRRHGVNWDAYRYQARTTGFAFDTEQCRWSDEWNWLGIDFDGCQPSNCLLQEAKGNYDQFFAVPDKPMKWFDGFKTMSETIGKQARVTRANPPAKLIWYFQTPRTRSFMLPVLREFAVTSVYQP